MSLWSYDLIKKMHYWYCAQICQPKFWWVWVFSIKLLSFYFGIFAITNFTLLCYCNARNKKWLVPYHNNWKTWLEIPTIINRFQQISQTLLSMCRTIMYIAKIVNSKLLLLSKASLKSCILSTNVMFGFMQKLVFIG